MLYTLHCIFSTLHYSFNMRKDSFATLYIMAKVFNDCHSLVRYPFLQRLKSRPWAHRNKTEMESANAKDDMKSSWRQLYHKYCGAVCGLVALLIILLTLFGGAEIGLSNNGDFSRVMRASSLSFGDVKPSYTYVSEYSFSLPEGSRLQGVLHILFSSEGWKQYPSVHVILVRLSAAVQYLFGASKYRMGVLGVIYAILYAGGLSVLCHSIRLSRLWADVLLKTVLIIVECDIGYVAYFNSFYSEPLQHIALLWFLGASIGTFTASSPSILRFSACSAAALVYGWTKFFNIPVALLMAVAVSAVGAIRFKRKTVVLPGLAAVILLLGIWCSVPSWMDGQTTYNSLFYGILRDVPEEEAQTYLADMGLPKELADWRDTNYYLSGAVSSMQVQGLWDAASGVDKADLVRFYLTHPARLFHQARLTAMHGGLVRPWYLANHGKGWPLMTYSQRMSLWSHLRSLLATDTLWANAIIAIVLILMACMYHSEHEHLAFLVFPAALVCALGYTFLMPVVLNGEGDLAKHLFAYIELIDIMLLGGAFMFLQPPIGVRPSMFRTAILLTALVLLLPAGLRVASHTRSEHASHSALEIGSYVSLGTYQGQKLTWVVTDVDGNSATLLCVSTDISRAFDCGGSNDWRTSSVREWLNSAFLEGFSSEEQALLQSRENPVILSNSLRAEAEQGDLEFACSHIPLLCGRGYQRAYKTVTTDLVTLPDVVFVTSHSEDETLFNGFDFWLETPYCPSSMLVRYVSHEGYVLFGQTETEKQIRPMIYIECPAVLQGSGTFSDPFSL